MAKNRNKPVLKILNDGECIVLYKANSGGIVVGAYLSVITIESLEKPFNKNFNNASVYCALFGHTKYFRSFYHACKVRPVIRKIEDFKHLLNG